MYREPKKYEEYAYILEYLPHGRAGTPRTSHGTSDILQLLGEDYFTLLEAAPKPEEEYHIRDRIYVGKGERAKVSHILGRISYDDIYTAGKAELPELIQLIVKNREEKFINFFNESPSLTPRMHSLELIPGIGKRLMFTIIDLRERTPFTDYNDLRERANLSDPVKMIAKRVLKELSQEEKYHIFTRPI